MSNPPVRWTEVRVLVPEGWHADLYYDKDETLKQEPVIADVPMPSIKDTEVMDKTRTVGICHSDYELLAGRRPFLGSSSGEYMGQHLFCAPPRLDSLVPGISAELAALTAALLRKEREDRPYMAEVLTSLEGMCAPLLAKSALLPLQRQQRPRPSRAGLGPLPVRRAVRWRAPARSVALSGIAMLGIAALSSSAHQGAWSPAPRQEDKADTAPAPAESSEFYPSATVMSAKVAI